MSENPSPPAEARLESWKEIAAYLNRDARTVMRWEKAEGLPIHRQRHLARSSVYAYPHELDAWRAQRRLESPVVQPVGGRHGSRLLAIAALLVISVLSAGGGRFLGPATAAAQQAPFGNRLIDQFMIGGPATLSGTEFDFSPDGRLVAFAKLVGSAQSRVTHLITRDLTSGEERTLATVGNKGIYAIGFSSDGLRVAARLRFGGSNRIQEELLIVPVRGGGEPVVLPWGTVTNDTFYRFRDQVGGWFRIAWSADGQWLAHLSPSGEGRFEPGLFNVATGASRPLGVVTDGPPDFLWSPAGDHLAVHVTDAAKGLDEIAVVPIAGGPIRTVPVQAGVGRRTRLLTWTTTPEIIVRLKGEASPFPADDFAMSLDTGALRKICTTPAGAVVEDERPFGGTGGPTSVDLCLGVTRNGSSQIVWNAASERLLVRDMTSGIDRPLTTGSGEERMAYLSPHEPIVIFTSNRDGRWALYAAPVDRAPVAAPALLTRLGGRPQGLAIRWFREGFAARIMYSESHIQRVNIDPSTGRTTGVTERLTQDDRTNFGPTISPDGARIAYWTDRGLSLMNTDGSRERPIVDRSGSTILDPPRWRSNDEVITVARLADDSRDRRFQITNVRTSAVQNVPGAPLPGPARWQYLPATDEIVYLVTDSVSAAPMLQTRRVRDGAERTLITLDTAGGRVYSFLVSPDGKQVAYVLQREKGCTPCELSVVNVETRERVLLASPNNHQTVNAWSPDGRYLLHGPARPRIMDLSTRQGWPLLEPPNQTEWGEDGEGAWAPDGSFVVFVSDSTAREWRHFSSVTAAAIGK